MQSLNYLNERAAQRKKLLILVPYIIALFSLLLIGQIIVQFMSVKQLNKDSAVISDMGIRIISWSHHKGSNRNTPNYGLVIRLNNNHVYNIENAVYLNKLNKELHLGDMVTIYYPTTIVKVLSAGFFHNVNQLERGKEILYNFEDEKKDGYILIALFTIFIGMFYGYYRFQHKYAI